MESQCCRRYPDHLASGLTQALGFAAFVLPLRAGEQLLGQWSEVALAPQGPRTQNCPDLASLPCAWEELSGMTTNCAQHLNWSSAP